MRELKPKCAWPAAGAVLGISLFLAAGNVEPARAEAAVPSAASPGEQDASFPDPFLLYGGKITFDVYRGGHKVGAHRVDFEREGMQLRMNAQMDLRINILFFTAYSFSYRSQETWEDGRLLAVSADVNDNGKQASVSAALEGGAFRIVGARGTSEIESWTFPTNHWHHGQVGAATLLNTITGRLARVETKSLGMDTVETAAGPMSAEQFEYTGELRDTRVWYDANGRWIKMSFKAKDGSWIEYRCTSCGQA